MWSSQLSFIKIISAGDFRVFRIIGGAADNIRRMSYKTSSEIPIIALTANSYQEDIRKCLDAGINIHLSKPIEIKKPLQQYFWKRILIWNGFIICLQKTMSSQIGSFLMGPIGFFTVFSVFERCFAIIAVKSTGEGPCIRKTVVQSNLQYRQIPDCHVPAFEAMAAWHRE